MQTFKCNWATAFKVCDASQNMFIFGSADLNLLDRSALTHCNMLQLSVFCVESHETDFCVFFNPYEKHINAHQDHI